MYQWIKDFAPLLGSVVASVVAAITLGIGIWQYRKTAERDFIRPLREAQLGRYQDACSATALLANMTRTDREWEMRYADFLRLYYGPLAILEDFERRPGERHLTVELAMILFKVCLEDPDPPGQQGKPDLKQLSLALAHACRESLGRSWGYDLRQLHGKYQQVALAYADTIKAQSKSEEVQDYFTRKL